MRRSNPEIRSIEAVSHNLCPRTPSLFLINFFSSRAINGFHGVGHQASLWLVSGITIARRTENLYFFQLHFDMAIFCGHFMTIGIVVAVSVLLSYFRWYRCALPYRLMIVILWHGGKMELSWGRCAYWRAR